MLDSFGSATGDVDPSEDDLGLFPKIVMVKRLGMLLAMR
jgi:hypothetical protein